MTRAYRLLIIVDFNIHVCCPSKPLVKEFVTLLEPLNIEQYVCGPTHNLGQTLELVLSCGLLISNMEVIEACVSDHYPVLFESECFSSSPTFAQHSHLSRVINSNTANLFSEHYFYMLPIKFD